MTVAEAAVESGEIDANDDVGFSFDGQLDELIKKVFKFAIILKSLEKTDYRVLGQIERKLDASPRHFCTAGAEKLGGRAAGGELIFERVDQFSREEIATGFTGDEHETCWVHPLECAQIIFPLNTINRDWNSGRDLIASDGGGWEQRVRYC